MNYTVGLGLALVAGMMMIIMSRCQRTSATGGAHVKILYFTLSCPVVVLVMVVVVGVATNL